MNYKRFTAILVPESDTLSVYAFITLLSVSPSIHGQYYFLTKACHFEKPTQFLLLRICIHPADYQQYFCDQTHEHEGKKRENVSA